MQYFAVEQSDPFCFVDEHARVVDTTCRAHVANYRRAPNCPPGAASQIL